MTPDSATRERVSWLDELRALAPELGAGLFDVEVLHDDWCALLTGRGPCDCSPDIVVRRVEPESGGGS